MSKQNASKNSMRGKRRVRKQSSKPSKAFVKKVQRIIHADTETKTVVFIERYCVQPTNKFRW